MKIGVNARFLTKPFTGVGRYTRFLFEELAGQNPLDEFVMVANLPVEITMPANVKIFVLPEKFPGTSGMRKTFWEQVQVPAFLQKHNVDLVHFPYPCNPWKGFSPPTVVTVHDCIPWTMSPYRRSISTRLYQDRCKSAVKKADHVFSVSKAALKEIIEVCALDPAKTSVSYNALPEIYHHKVHPAERLKVLEKYGISQDRPYFFYVGGFDVRKNVEILVAAYREFVAPDYEIDLVLAGGKHLNDRIYKSFDLLTKSRDGGKLQPAKGQIRATGFVADEDLPALYQSSFAFVNLSAKEGFNLPLLEALVSGTPTVISDIPVHHEVASDHAAYCRIEKKEAGKVLKKLFIDKDYYQKQKQKAEDFRCPFSWQKTAAAVMGVYRTLL